MISTKVSKRKVELEGKTFPTNEGFNVTIINYIDRHNVSVRFDDENAYETTTTMQNIRKGQIKNPFYKCVYGVGYYGNGKYTARLNGVKTREYIKWHSMLTRCYSEIYQQKQPKYKDCYVDDDFLNFQVFAQWFNDNWYYHEENLELDKDLLIKGNRKYSGETCCLIPKKINTAITYKADDKEYMRDIYNHYKGSLPDYIESALCSYL